MQANQLSSAALAVKQAVEVLRPRFASRDRKKDRPTKWSDRSNSDIDVMHGVMELPSDEEPEGKRREAFELKLGLKQLMFGIGKNIFGKTRPINKALTTLAVVNRVDPVEARFMFAWLYGHRDDEKLTYLASTLYHRVEWPTDTGRTDPRVGLNICISVLLRHYWWRNGSDYDRGRRPMSPTAMSGCLGLEEKSKGPAKFHKFQRDQIFPIMSQWETMADNQISQELSDKGFFGG